MAAFSCMGQVMIILLLIWSGGKALYAQPRPNKVIRQASKALENRQPYQALLLLKPGVQAYPQSKDIQFLTGKAYWLNQQKARAVPHLKQAYQLKGVTEFTHEIAAFYARVLQYLGNFIEAERLYRHILADQAELTPDSRRFMFAVTECQTAQKAYQTPIPAEIRPLPEGINSRYPDFAPVISIDAEQLYFTSRRPENMGKQAVDGYSYEDIFEVERRQGQWSIPQRLPPPVNTEVQDACISLSNDGQRLYFFRSDGGGNLFWTEKKGKDWQNPKSMGSPINHPEAREPSMWFSASGRFMVFVSDRPGGMGGLDLYYAVQDQHGNWKPPVNLGPPLNTPFDEDAPFLHPDGRTLYFSSNGHPGLGGHDIFKTEFLGAGQWSRPENLGYPVNTSAEELYFTMAADGQTAYLTSDRPGGLGHLDIYQVRFKKESPARPKRNVVLLKGMVSDTILDQPLPAALTVIRLSGGDTVARMFANEQTGKYLFTLPPGEDYAIHADYPGYSFYSEHLSVPDTSGYREIKRNIYLYPLTKGQRVELRNIFFDFDKAELRKTSLPELRKLYNLLQQHPKLSIEIIGHTDNQGSDAYNLELSRKRAKSVVDYLLELGISQDRLSSTGKGSRQPIATNATEAGRQRNRRTEFLVLTN